MSLTLFCLPCAGGSAAMYLRWRRSMPSHIDVVPLELPGRGACMGQVALRDFDALIDWLLPRVHAHLDTAHRQAAGAHGYAFFGHSMGALLAYGLARRLAVDVVPQPAILFLSACAAPTRRLTDRFSRADDASLIADLRAQNGTPAAVFDDPDLLRMTLDLLGADYDVCRSFGMPASATAPLAMPLQVLGGSDDSIDTERLQAWRSESSGAFALDWFEGDHFYLRRHEQALLARICARLDEVGIAEKLRSTSAVEVGHAA